MMKSFTWTAVSIVFKLMLKSLLELCTDKGLSTNDVNYFLRSPAPSTSLFNYDVIKVSPLADLLIENQFFKSLNFQFWIWQIENKINNKWKKPF